MQTFIPYFTNKKAAAESGQNILIGDVVLTTGSIIACDPLTVTSPYVGFYRRVAPGTYPVYAFEWEKEERYAYAFMRFSNKKVVRWEMATIEGQELSSLSEGKIFGHGVDTGLSCFMDEETLLLFEKRMNEFDDNDYFDDVISYELEANDDKFCLHIPEATQSNNVAIFRSGYGDGYYASYWGLDKDDKPVCLLTDFNILPEYKEVKIKSKEVSEIYKKAKKLIRENKYNNRPEVHQLLTEGLQKYPNEINLVRLRYELAVDWMIWIWKAQVPKIKYFFNDIEVLMQHDNKESIYPFYKALVYKHLKEYENALAYYKAALAIDPNCNLYAYKLYAHQIVSCLILLGRDEEALQMLDEQYEKYFESVDTSVANNIAVLYYRNGDKQKAKEYIKKAKYSQFDKEIIEKNTEIIESGKDAKECLLVD